MSQYLRIGTLSVFFLLLMTGCADIRKLTYPSDFVYLDKSMLAGVMQDMAASINKINKLVSDSGRSGNSLAGELQNQVLVELNNLESIADGLNANGNLPDSNADRRKTNHLLVDENIGTFLKDIATAKLEVEADPPSYFMVGRLSGGCSACHAQ